MMRFALAAVLAFLQPVSAYAQFRGRAVVPGIVAVPPVIPTVFAVPGLSAPTPAFNVPAPAAFAAPAASLPAPAATFVPALPAPVSLPALPAPASFPALPAPASLPAPAAPFIPVHLAGPNAADLAPQFFDGTKRPDSAEDSAVPAAPAGIRAGSWDLRPAAKSVASVVVVGPRNFELPEDDSDSDDLMPGISSSKDPDTRSMHTLISSPLDPMEAMMVLRLQFHMTQEQAQAQVERLPAVLKTHFEETLARHAHDSAAEDGAVVHTVRDGLSFWADFSTPTDPEKRAAAAVFMRGTVRRMFSKDFAYGLVYSLAHATSANSRVVDATALSTADRDALVRLAESTGLRTARAGRWLLVGSGTGFHLMRSIMASAQALSDPAQTAKLDKVLGFVARRGISIGRDQHLAAAAFYHPLDRRLAFVMPSRADLNTLSHEGTHARFHAFEDRLDHWLRARNYALPYEVDGPAVAIIGHGGYFNLLNELNSWRLGESFDGGKSDADILALLRDSYGRQAGAEAAAVFGRQWPVERVNGVSVPRLIRRSVRTLNMLEEASVDELGRNAIMTGDGGAQRDFLRLAAARFAKSAAMSEARRRIAAALVERGSDDGVRGAAERLLRPDEKEPAPGSRAAARRDYSKAASTWIKGLAAEGTPVIPLNLTFGAESVFRFAHESGLTDYDAVIRGLQKRFGADAAVVSSSERALFKTILSRPEKGLEAKIKAYLAEFNARGFKTLWTEFAKNPGYDLRKLLVDKHKDEFTPAHAAQLVRWALDGAAPESLKTGAADLLEGLLSAHGLDTLYPRHQLESLQAMQRSMNEAKGVPPDADMPKNRAPGGPHRLLGPEVDRALAKGMFDGNPGIHRLKIIELITQRTYPEELPALRARVVSVLTDATAPRFDQWVARMFMVPADSFLFSAHARWGSSVARAVLDDSSPNATALEFVGEHLRQGLGATLKGPSWGRYHARLDEMTRREAIDAVTGYSPEDAVEYRQALDDLWRLINHADPKVAKSALYALVERPVFFLGLEERLAAAPPTPLIRELLAMTEPGFVPALEAAAASARAPLSPAAAFVPEGAPSLKSPPPAAGVFAPVLRLPARVRAAVSAYFFSK